MTRQIVFAKTRHHYDSYIDFWRFVEACNFDIQYVDEIDVMDDKRVYIFTPFNGEVMARLPAWRMRRAKIVWWNLERWEDETRETSMQSMSPSVDAVWTSDRTVAARDSRCTFVLLAGHPNFGMRVLERRYDVCHLAYLYGRRKETIDAIRERGASIAPEAWGRAQQDHTVGRSHLMLNMHQYEGMDVVAPIRFAVAASYGIPIISEPFADRASDPLVLAQAPRFMLTNIVIDALADKDRLRIHGAKLFERMCVDTTFEAQVRYAVEGLR